MPQSLFIPVPYYQFAPYAADYEFSAFNYKPVPNKKVHRHCPFIIIDTDYINEPLMDVAIAAAKEEAETPSNESAEPVASEQPVISDTEALADGSDNADGSVQTETSAVQPAEKAHQPPNHQVNEKPAHAQQIADTDSEPKDPQSAAKEKERLDYLARQPADPKHNKGNSIEKMQQDESELLSEEHSSASHPNPSSASPAPPSSVDANSSSDAINVADTDTTTHPESIITNNNESNSSFENKDETHSDRVEAELDVLEEENISHAAQSDSDSTDSKTDVASDTNDEADDVAQESVHDEDLPQEAQKDDDEDNDDDELTEEEKQKQEKEEKLESYRQFVAEQKSKVDVDYQGIRVDIEANALPSRMYFIMNALSAIIASYGLVINSAAVVIGAMLVAMMLGPISGVALAIIDYRIPFLRKSLMTVVAGGAMVIFIGFMVGFLHQDTPLSNEILSRTQPTSMDLMIALAGGTAGAYAMISPHLSVAVVGVAVATALVPPLAASGILFAHGEGTLGLGALLLAITNIIAIQFTNALVLWFTGFRRLVKDDYKTNTYYAFIRRNVIPLVLLAGIGAYLTYNFNAITKTQSFENTVKETIGNYFIEQGNALTATQFLDQKDHQTVRAVIRGETTPSPSDAKKIEAIINQQIEESYPKHLPVRIQLRYMPVVVIESEPNDTEKLNQTDVAILTNE